MMSRDCYSPTTGADGPSDPMPSPSASSSFACYNCVSLRWDERRTRTGIEADVMIGSKLSREDKEYSSPRVRSSSNSKGVRGEDDDEEIAREGNCSERKRNTTG